MKPTTLSLDDVREQLDKILAADRKHMLVAFYGTGELATVETKAGGTVEVIPVKSELELREKVPKVTEPPTRAAFLVSFAAEIPLDLAGLFAKRGRVLRIGREARIKHLFGAADFDPEVLRNPLTDYLLEKGSGTGSGSGSGFDLAGRNLTLDAMWSAWLGAEWKVPTSGGLARDTLLGWGATANGGGVFLERAQTDENFGKLREGLFEHLSSRLGPAGPVVWKAWEKGQGSKVLELALIFEGLEGCDVPEVGMWVRLVAKRELGASSDEDAKWIVRDLARTAESALRYVEHTEGAKSVRALLREADEYPTEKEVRKALSRSRMLSSAWQHLLGELGSLLKRGAQKPTAKLVDQAAETLQKLEEHQRFKDPENGPVFKRAEMAVKLLSWLTTAPHRELPGSATPHGDVEALGRWYAEEGGFVDWARGVARGLDEDELGAGVQAVVEAADAERSELDRRFARSLVHWYEAGRPASQVVPIDDAVRRVAVEFLKGDDERRLLVLLLDGMAWTQAVELLHDLGSRAAPWGPLAWHASKAGRVGDGSYPVVLAQPPTVTEVSRAAFFAGKPTKPGAKLTAEKDPERWAAHRDVRGFFSDLEIPRLLLRSEGHTSSGSASKAALNLVGDDGQRVVAVVINAIDASLHGDSQKRNKWTVGNVKSLGELLEKAKEAGRAVLLASDHGHVPSDRLRSVPSTPGCGARWRPWKDESEPLADFEIGLSHPTVWTPRGAHGVVLLADDAHRYGGSADAGVHGGVTLAEMVAPCVLIGCEERCSSGAEDDQDLAVRPPLVPGWWHFDTSSGASVAPEEPRTSRRKNPVVDERQIPLIDEEQGQGRGEVGHGHGLGLGVATAFEKSAVLKARAPTAQARKQVVRAVAFLMGRNGAASEEALAAATETLPFRIGGLISKLQEVLNVDGYHVLRYEREARQVYLDVEMLEAQFEVTS